MNFDIFYWIIYLMATPNMLHIMQQESYQNDGMYRWLLNNPKKAFKSGFIGIIITLLAYLISAGVIILLTNFNVIRNTPNWVNKIPSYIAILALFIYNIICFVKSHKERKEAKKPLKYTARVKRLIFYNFIVLVILELFFIQTFITDENTLNLYYPFIYAFLLFTIPINMIIANWLVSPLETWIGNGFIKKAYRKLNQDEYKNLIKIGITGSYGKTSTKFILKTILEEKYKVLATPGSFNTTMGNVRVIREQLKPEHEVFISEMGARKKHDIREICDFVKPHIGIITSIGAQHLETFKNIETVAKTKGELLTGTKNKNNPNYLASPYDTIFGMLKTMTNPKNYGLGKKEEITSNKELNNILEDGAIFLPKDGSYCEELYNNDQHERKYLFSLNDKSADVSAKNIKVTAEGSEFTVVSKKNKEYKCTTKLLGEHNVQNIIGAIAIAEYLGLTKEQIQNGVAKIEPVEHRLQLIPSSNGTTVIDDAFNSNPEGSRAALDVISKFNGRKIIITPGMVELGGEEAKFNKEFGKHMASVVDIAILVGPKHTKPIQDGLKEQNFNDMNIYVVTNLDEATQKLAKLTKAGDVILFENDLPDSYNES